MIPQAVGCLHASVRGGKREETAASLAAPALQSSPVIHWSTHSLTLSLTRQTRGLGTPIAAARQRTCYLKRVIIRATG